MALFNFRREPPPKPKPWFSNASILSPIIFAVIIGLTSIVWNGLASDITTLQNKVQTVEKEKATNEDVKDALKELKSQSTQQNKAIQQNQIAIKELLIRQEVSKEEALKTEPVKEKLKVVSPEIFEKFIKLDSEAQNKYRTYLQKRGYDVSDLE